MFYADPSEINYKTGLAQENLGFANADPFKEYASSYLKFDGISSIVKLDSSIAFSGDFCVSFWFKMESWDCDALSSNNGNSKVNIEDSTTIGLRIGAISDDFIVPTMSLDVWYHCVVVRMGSTGKVYLNGTESSTGSIAVASSSFVVESFSKIGSFDFHGCLNTVTMWDDTVPTENEVESIYNLENNGDTPTVILNPDHVYSFEGTGSIVTDSGSVGVNGVLGNPSPFKVHSNTSFYDYDGEAKNIIYNNGALEIPLTSEINVSGEFTFCCWINQTGFEFEGWIIWGDSRILIAEDGNTIRVRIDGVHYPFTTPVTRSTNQWYFLVITRDSNDDLRAYLDATESSTGPLNAPGDLTFDTIFRDNSQDRYYGYVDEIVLKQGLAASVAQINSLYNSGNGVDPSIELGTLTHWYKCNESAGSETLTDSGSSGVDGGLTDYYNTQPTRVLEEFYDSGKYMEFNGDVAVVLSSSISLQEDFVVAFWFNTKATFNKMVISGSNPKDRITMYNTTTLRITTDGSNQSFTLPETLSTDSWYHVMISRSGSSVNLYLNGVISTYTRTISETLTFTEIGGLGSSIWVGDLDDIVIYDGISGDANDALAFYNSGNGVDPTTVIAGPKHWYKFNESAHSAKVTDSGSGGADGDLVNFHSVNHVDDLSGNGVHATQSRSEDQMTIIKDGGRALISEIDKYAKTSDVVVSTNNQLTVLAVVKRTGGSESDMIVCSDPETVTGERIFHLRGDGLLIFDGTTGYSLISDVGVGIDSNYHLIYADHDSSGKRAFLDGLANGTTTESLTINNVANEIWIGDNRDNNTDGFVGQIVDVMIWDGKLSDEDRNVVEGYVAHKMNSQYNDSTILDSLPSNHPYKTTPPKS